MMVVFHDNIFRLIRGLYGQDALVAFVVQRVRSVVQYAKLIASSGIVRCGDLLTTRMGEIQMNKQHTISHKF